MLVGQEVIAPSSNDRESESGIVRPPLLCTSDTPIYCFEPLPRHLAMMFLNRENRGPWSILAPLTHTHTHVNTHTHSLCLSHTHLKQAHTHTHTCTPMWVSEDIQYASMLAYGHRDTAHTPTHTHHAHTNTNSHSLIYLCLHISVSVSTRTLTLTLTLTHTYRQISFALY